MMQIVESGDDYFEPRFSNGSRSCLFPSLSFVGSPRGISYKQLQRPPLRLTVVKLDGSSFGIEVSKSGTVAELKRAVEAVFDHFPKMGPDRVSWSITVMKGVELNLLSLRRILPKELVWGQFCLCHEGQKLLIDSDYISMIGIRDGDELQFVHHASNTCNFVKIKSKKKDPDVDYIPRITNGYDDGQQNHGRDDGSHSEITEDHEPDDSESDDDTSSRCEGKLSGMLRGWFPYQKLNNSHKRLRDRSCSAVNSSSRTMLGSFKNVIRFSSDRYDSRGETWKRI